MYFNKNDGSCYACDRNLPAREAPPAGGTAVFDRPEGSERYLTEHELNRRVALLEEGPFSSPEVVRKIREEGHAARGVLAGRKDDAGKPAWSFLLEIPLYLTPECIRPVVDRLRAGAEHYGPMNWLHVENPRERYREALLRHLIAMFAGDTSEDHEAGAICCLLFLRGFKK